MDGDGIREAVETETATELDRLGSGKLMIALTGADMNEDTVLAAVAAATGAAATTLETWAGDEPDESAREAFAHVAERAADHHERVREVLPEGSDPDAVEGLDLGLGGHEETAERAGAGLVGWPLVADRVLGQAISFFINEADTRRTDRLRDVRSDVRSLGARGAELLEVICDDEADADRAREAAEAAVGAAYDDYVDRLEAMGLDPKPIC